MYHYSPVLQILLVNTVNRRLPTCSPMGVHDLAVFASAVPKSIFRLDPLVLIMLCLHRNFPGMEAVSIICLRSLAQ